MMQLAAELLLLPALAAAGMRVVHEDCNLNGFREGQQQGCRCLPGWRGSTCGELALLPASPGAGLHAQADANMSSWGGSVAWDPGSGRWVGFFNELALGCGINAWEANSRIVRASTADLDKPFAVDAVIKPAFGSEQTLARKTAMETDDQPQPLVHIHPLLLEDEPLKVKAQSQPVSHLDQLKQVEN